MAWDDILGHEFAKRLFQTHLASGQVPSAYLLAGPEGVGKRRLAFEMAKALNCAASGSRPCEACPPCIQIGRGTHPDTHAIIPGGASDHIRIDEVRRLISRIALRPYSASVQVAVIDGAERLTEEAANSLLKALEEPPLHTRFLLLTSRLSQCLPTIISRCQLIRCEALPAEAVRRILIEGQGCDPQIAEAIARLSQGSASCAIDLAGRWTEYQTILARFASEGSAPWLEQSLPETREDVMQLLDGMMGWLRDLAVAATANPAWVAHALHESSLRHQAEAIDVDRCLAIAFELITLRESMDQFVSPRLVAALAREKWISLIQPEVRS